MITLIIKGNPPSKSNCYRVGKAGNRCIMFKGKQLKEYEASFAAQVPEDCKQGFEGDLMVVMHCYFSSRRPDLDNAAKCCLDQLQATGVILNDRQVMRLFMRKYLDKENPRVEILIDQMS